MSDRGVLLLYCKKNLRAARQEEEEKEEKSENLAKDEVFIIAAYFDRFQQSPLLGGWIALRLRNKIPHYQLARHRSYIRNSQPCRPPPPLLLSFPGHLLNPDLLFTPTFLFYILNWRFYPKTNHSEICVSHRPKKDQACRDKTHLTFRI